MASPGGSTTWPGGHLSGPLPRPGKLQVSGFVGFVGSVGSVGFVGSVGSVGGGLTTGTESTGAGISPLGSGTTGGSVPGPGGAGVSDSGLSPGGCPGTVLGIPGTVLSGAIRRAGVRRAGVGRRIPGVGRGGFVQWTRLIEGRRRESGCRKRAGGSRRDELPARGRCLRIAVAGGRALLGRRRRARRRLLGGAIDRRGLVVAQQRKSPDSRYGDHRSRHGRDGAGGTAGTTTRPPPADDAALPFPGVGTWLQSAPTSSPARVSVSVRIPANRATGSQRR